MGVLSTVFGKSQDLVYAERELRRREDHLMAMDPMEETSLPIHAKADAERLGVVLGRMRVVQATSEQNSNRNMLATLVTGIGVVLILKGGPLADAAWHLLTSL